MRHCWTKCRNLHCHRRGLRCHFEVERDGDISAFWVDFHSQIELWLKENYDHGMLINIHDSLYETLQQHMARTGETFRLKVIDGPTSVENLCHLLFTEITRMRFHLAVLEFEQTDTSDIHYTREDWIVDNRRFASRRSHSDSEVVSLA